MKNGNIIVKYWAIILFICTTIFACGGWAYATNSLVQETKAHQCTLEKMQDEIVVIKLDITEIKTDLSNIKETLQELKNEIRNSR